MCRGHRRIWALLAVPALLLWRSPSRALEIALQSTPVGVAGRVSAVVDLARGIGPNVGLDADLLASLSVCDDLEPALAEGRAEGFAPCARVLGEVYGAAVAAPADAPEPDPLRRGVRWFVASGVADAAMRLASARAAVDAGAPGRMAPPPGTGAQVLVLDDGQTLRVRPVRALRPGRRWALVLEGLGKEELEYARSSVVPRPGDGGIRVPSGSLADPVRTGLRDAPPVVDREAAVRLARRLERDIDGAPGTSPIAGVQFRLPRPLTPADLERIVATFEPVRQAPDDRTVVELPVVDARRSLIAYREGIDEIPCEAPATKPRPDLLAKGSAGRAFEGVYSSLDIGRERERRLVEVGPQAAAVDRIPYVLAVPDDVGPDTPLVVAVHGHGGAADAFLSTHAPALLARGLAMLSVELPEHGLRGSKAMEFLGVADPTRLRVNYRQSVVDILAAIRTGVACGFRLPDGAVYRPTDLRYLGYSLGSLLGLTVRSLAPALGPTVLAAPAGDLAGWLMLHFPSSVGSPVVTCVGGDDHGRACLADRRCAAPGICWVDPSFSEIATLFALPFGLVLADAEPLGPARVRTGDVSRGPVLLLTGGQDGVLFSLLQARLADAYDMHGEPPGPVVGPRSERRHWSTLGHDLLDAEEVRTTAYDFLASGGRRPRSSRARPSVDNNQAAR